MNILFLGDIVGRGGCKAIKEKLPKIINDKKIDFVIANGENAADDGNGITKNISESLLNSGIDVLTSGNHIWDKKEINEYIKEQKRLLRPLNFYSNSPGNGYMVYKSKNNFKVGVLNLMGNVFMDKCDNAFSKAKDFLEKYKLKKDFDFLIVDFHGEITSEKMALGHYFDGLATLVVGTHTHVPTQDGRVLKEGTAYLTDAGMCGDYNSVMGFNKKIFLKKLLKRENFEKNFPVEDNISLSGLVVEADEKNGLATKIYSLIYGGTLKNFY